MRRKKDAAPKMQFAVIEITGKRLGEFKQRRAMLPLAHSYRLLDRCGSDRPSPLLA
jgi:hypothetical protein